MATSAIPTTAVPTTAAPTTGIPTDIDCGYVDIIVTNWLGVSLYPVPIPNFWLNNRIDLSPITILITFDFEMVNICFDIGYVNIIILPVGQAPVVGMVVDCSYTGIIIEPWFTYVTIEAMRRNWVKWTKIGHVDFTIDQSNEAGERPLDWSGWVYHILKLGDKVVAYGENGVTFLAPKDINWGMSTQYRIGIKNKGAVAGSESIHFFVDKQNQLLKLDDKFNLLGYAEFISQLGSTVILTYDIFNELLYICDGTKGFIYSPRSESFGEGPPNVSGIVSSSGTLYTVAPGTIVVPKLLLKTDIYDFGTRKNKDIESIEIGTDLTEALFTSVEYRTSNKKDFRQIGWFLVNPSGMSFPKCYGVEFRFLVKSYIKESLEIDYLRVKGHIHGYNPLDIVNSSLNTLTDFIGKRRWR